jgi:hypothetical protein
LHMTTIVMSSIPRSDGSEMFKARFASSGWKELSQRN